MAVRRAVIPAAGLGTRILPATKAVPKELLPLVDKPMIQHVVEEAAAAGIREVVIVTGPGKAALEEHFRPAPVLERALAEAGKDDLLAAVHATTEIADVSFVTQDEPLGLGHAVWCAREAVGRDPFCVLLPDELFGGPGLVRALAGHTERLQAPVIAVMRMPPSEIGNYGVVDPLDGDAGTPSGDLVRMRSFVEKPDPAEAPSDLGSVGRYVLTPEVMDALEGTEPGAGGEIQLTDAIAAVAAAESAYAHVHGGERWDVGRKLGYLYANVAFGLRDEQIGAELRELVGDLLERG